MSVVRAKMKVNTITQSGDPKHPQVNVQLGAVYSNDPESENRSFANATPSASVQISIDAGRPAAKAFELGCEYYVDFIRVGVPELKYIKDGGFPPAECDVVLSTRDGTKEVRARWKPSIITATIDGVEITDNQWTPDKFNALGFTHWRALRDGELPETLPFA